MGLYGRIVRGVRSPRVGVMGMRVLAALLLVVGMQSIASAQSTPSLPSLGFDIGDVITAVAEPIGVALVAVIMFGCAMLVVSVAWKWLRSGAKTR